MPTFRYPANCIERLPDHAGDRYRFRFRVQSSSGSGTYIIAYDTAGSWWTCSCPSAIHRGHCKHLDAAGLFGRRYGRSPLPELEPALIQRSAAVMQPKKARTKKYQPRIMTAAEIRAEKARVRAAEEEFLSSAPEELIDALAEI
jgi:hypothetical protein